MTSGAFSARRNLTHFTASFSDLKASHPPTVLWFITSSLVGVFTEKPCTRFWETSIPLVVEQICSIQPLLTQSRWSGGNALFSQMQPFTYQPPCAVATYVIQISLFCFHQSALSICLPHPNLCSQSCAETLQHTLPPWSCKSCVFPRNI